MRNARILSTTVIWILALSGFAFGAPTANDMKTVGRGQQSGRSFPLTPEKTRTGAPGNDGPPAAPADAEQLAKEFVSLLARHDFQKAADLFDAAMKSAAPPDKLKAIWIDWQNTYGAWQSIQSICTVLEEPYRVVYVTCQFEIQPVDVKVVVDPASKISGLFYTTEESAEYQYPSYVNPETFQEEDVVVGGGEWALPGTLSMPVGRGPYPAVVLVQGSGPNDRDESIGPNKPFRDLAWGLASRSIAVLRYEKRTKHYAARIAASIQGFTVNEETIADALEAVSLLQQTEGVDPNRVFVLGHSLGGMLAPRMGATRPDIAGIILMAAPARPLEDLVLEQSRFQASLPGPLAAETRSKLPDIQRQVAAIKKLTRESPTTDLLLNVPPSYWLDLQGYDPVALATALKQPMLILQGEKDCQVGFTADFARWQKAFHGRRNATLKSYPALNHPFMEVQGKSTGMEYVQVSHVAESVVTDVASWIKQH